MKHVLTALCLAASAGTCLADTFQVSVPPRKQDAYQSATYRVWIPPGVKTLRGLIMRQHGCGEGARRFGLAYPDDIQWRELARQYDCALMGSQMISANKDCQTWCIPFNGTKDAYLRGLKKLSAMSAHPELEHVPWAL